MKNIVWLRRDLRLHDHAGFQAAQSKGSVIALYIFTPETAKKHDQSQVQRDFILHSLRLLEQELQLFGIPLKILNLNRFEDIPKALVAFVKKHEVEAVYGEKYPGWDERVLDQSCEKRLVEAGVKFYLREGFSLLPPQSVVKSDGSPYQVFTAYKGKWIEKCLGEKIFLQADQNHLKSQSISISSDPIPKAHSSWALSEKALHQKLKLFVKNKVLQYAEHRDFPSLSGTSEFSPYLAQGILSPKQILVELMRQYEGDFLRLLNKKGIEAFIGELIWRDFYQMILYHFPKVSKHEPLKSETASIEWIQGRVADDHFKAWCEGKTGFPIVDAAMRCLNQTGFMHNRLRMISAMFLSKLLLIDWRRGEAYFMRHLVDGELGANNGGWQWCASTGTDAVPYFRIFNPLSQSKKFDPEGEFIRKFVPELQGLSREKIHEPGDEIRDKAGYPKPIIDYRFARERALLAFKPR